MIGVVRTPALRVVLVATDGFASADVAVAYAIGLAGTCGARLTVCCAIDRHSELADLPTFDGEPSSFEPRTIDLEAAARTILSTALRRAHAAGVRASAEMVAGRPAEAIVAAADAAHADAIVVGTSAKRGLDLFCMGSTADGVLRRANVPVFVVTASTSAAMPSVPRILVAIDASEASDAALDFALALAPSEPGATLVICAVAATDDVPPAARPALRLATARLATSRAASVAQAHLLTEVDVREGDAVDAILASAAALRATAIVLGTHGARGIGRAVYGSVAEGVVRSASVPVAVVRRASRVLVAR